MLISVIEPCASVMKTISHDIKRTTTVLIAVARLELTLSIPTFARIDVSAAKTEESNAKTNHIVFHLLFCTSQIFIDLCAALFEPQNTKGAKHGNNRRSNDQVPQRTDRHKEQVVNSGKNERQYPTCKKGNENADALFDRGSLARPVKVRNFKVKNKTEHGEKCRKQKRKNEHGGANGCGRAQNNANADRAEERRYSRKEHMHIEL